MSFNAVAEPLTDYGVRLGEVTELHTPRFHIHECGFLPFGVEGWNAAFVSSPFWRLWYFLGEDYWLECNEKRWEMNSKCIAFAPAHVVFSAGGLTTIPQLWAHFSIIPSYAFEVDEPFVIPITALLREQIKSLIREHQRRPNGESTQIYHGALALLHNCFAHHPLEMRALPESLRAILHLIEESYASDLSNARLARHAGMSTGHFIRWFKEPMNQSPHNYVHEIRLKRASWLLLFSELSIGQIAAEVGFSNRDYFSRAFINHAGCGPATFRKNHHTLTK